VEREFLVQRTLRRGFHFDSDFVFVISVFTFAVFHICGRLRSLISSALDAHQLEEKEQGFRKTLLDTCCSTCPVHFHATAAFHTHHHMQHSLTDRPPTFFANSLGLSSFGAILSSWLLMSLSTAVNPTSPFWRWPFFLFSNWLSCSHKFCSEAQGVSAVGG
jgi:hypothetical protein